MYPKKEMKYCILIFAILALAACKPSITETISIDDTPILYPDYNDVTVPCNIAPINFSTISYDSLQGIEATVKTPEGSTYTFTGKRYIDFTIDTWREITRKAKGEKIEISVSEIKNNKKYIYRPFYVNIANEEIDPYLSYRLITPGYHIYSHMGIYCRNLTTFEQKTVVDNHLINSNCVNCHSFCNGDAEKASLHVRGDLGSTVLKDGNNITICNAVNNNLGLNCVYPYWHPSGKYIAYSQNNTAQSFHCYDPNRVEVFDSESRVVVYDINNNILLTSPEINSTNTFTTEPSFSPDGKYLYYTSAKAIDMVKHTKEARYDICRIGFNESNGTFSHQIDTLVKTSKDSTTAAFPRPSHDGKYLLYSKFNYGQFGIWHTEADLWMLNLETLENYPLTNANSPNAAESYHSWSQNSKWIVFESRRDDGFFTRAYFAYIDNNGKAHKAFLLPQENPAQNRALMYSYNVPELSTKEFKFDKGDLERKLKSGEKLQFGYHNN